MNVVLHFAAEPALAARIRAALPDWIELTLVPEADRDGFAAAMGTCEVLWHVLDPVTAATMEAAPSLRLVQKIGVGVNTIDLDAAHRLGVAVANMPGTNTTATAELALALMLAAMRKVPTFDRAVRDGAWYESVGHVSECSEIHGSTVGLVGYGAVARHLATVLDALGAKVLYTARTPKDGAVGEWRELDRLLAEADVVSLHATLTDDTRHLIDAAALARMRRGAVLVNTARGALVDEDALCSALASGHVRAAGLDVFAHEPLPATSPLLALPNVVVAPHVGWLTPETFDRSIGVAVENCRRLRDGDALLHPVVTP
ncbi:MAG: hydroxyacid dehydrogenase [Acidimicrobiia bacterium]|nr:hydroxyacid dehydrogenase [Acidimicrobiia bacterium]